MKAGATIQLGGFPVCAQGWPSDWLEHAVRRYPASSTVIDEPLRVDLTVERGPPRRQKLSPPRIEIANGHVSIDCPPDVQARYAVGESALTVSVTEPETDETLHMSLENALRAYVSVRLSLHLDGLMLHAASAVLDDRGLAFAGLSGAGKTTLATGFEEAAGLSDDLSLIDRVGSAPRLLPSPFFGRIGRPGADRSAPLAAVVLLEQGPVTQLERLRPGEAAKRLLRHVVAYDPSSPLCTALLARVTALAERVPVVAVHRSLRDSSDALCRRVLEAT